MTQPYDPRLNFLALQQGTGLHADPLEERIKNLKLKNLQLSYDQARFDEETRQENYLLDKSIKEQQLENYQLDEEVKVMTMIQSSLEFVNDLDSYNKFRDRFVFGMGVDESILPNFESQKDFDANIDRMRMGTKSWLDLKRKGKTKISYKLPNGQWVTDDYTPEEIPNLLKTLKSKNVKNKDIVRGTVKGTAKKSHAEILKEKEAEEKLKLKYKKKIASYKANLKDDESVSEPKTAKEGDESGLPAGTVYVEKFKGDTKTDVKILHRPKEEKDRPEPGGLTEGSVITAFDNYGLDQGDPDLSGRMYDYYQTLRKDKKMSREEAFNETKKEFAPGGSLDTDKKTDYGYLWE